LVLNYALSSQVLPKQARQLTAVHNKLHHPQYASCIKAAVFVPLSVKLQITSYNDGFALYAANGCHHSTATPPPPCFQQHTRLSLSGGEPSSVAVSKEKSSGPPEKAVGLPRAISGTVIEEAIEGQDIWITKTSVLHTSYKTCLWKSNYGFRQNVTAAFKSVSPVCCYNPASTCQNAGHWALEVSGQTLLNPV